MVLFVFYFYYYLFFNVMISLLLYKLVKILFILGYFNQEDNMLIVLFDDVVFGSGWGIYNVVIFGVQEQGIGVICGYVLELIEVVGVYMCIIQYVLDIGGLIEICVQIGV